MAEQGRRFRIWRSRFGWWVAVDMDETLAEFDWPTHYRSFTRDRLIRKLRRRINPKQKPYEEIVL